MKINIPRMLLHLRRELVEGPEAENNAGAKLLARGYAAAMSKPGLLSALRMVGKVAQKPLAKKGKISWMPLPLVSRWTRSRDLPELAPRTFHEIWRQELSEGPGEDA